MDSTKLRYTLNGAGWADLELGVGGESLCFRASDLGRDPLATLIKATLDVNAFFQGTHPHGESPDFSISVELYGEPSGLQMIFFPKEFPRVRLRVYHAPDVDSIPYRQMVHSSEKKLVLEGEIGVDAFGRDLLDEASRILCETGLCGYLEAWGSDFPLAEFVQLHDRVAGISSSEHSTFEHELATLQGVLRERTGS